jgi:hypothetical protein
LDLELRKKLVNCYIWSIAVYGAEKWMLQAVDQKHLESFEMWCWRRMEISWTEHVRNEKVLIQVKEQRNILHKISKWKGMAVKRMEVLGVSVRNMKPLTVKMETVAMTGKGRWNRICLCIKRMQ